VGLTVVSGAYEMGRVVRSAMSPAGGQAVDPTVHAIPVDSMTAACGELTQQRITVTWRLRGVGSAPVCPACLELVG
jgi:hypothetical protein